MGELTCDLTGRPYASKHGSRAPNCSATGWEPRPQLLRCHAAPSGGCSDGARGGLDDTARQMGTRAEEAARLHRRDDSGRQRPAPLRSAPAQAAGTAKWGHPSCWATSQRRRAAQERRTGRRAAVPRALQRRGTVGVGRSNRRGSRQIESRRHPSAPRRLASNAGVGNRQGGPPRTGHTPGAGRTPPHGPPGAHPAGFAGRSRRQARHVPGRSLAHSWARHVVREMRRAEERAVVFHFPDVNLYLKLAFVFIQDYNTVNKCPYFAITSSFKINMFFSGTHKRVVYH
jgi:hypothetical protein